MAIALRDYQVKLLDDTRAALKTHRSVVVQLPTGGGKTAIATTMLAGVAARGAAGNFFVHRQELIEQTVRTFKDYGIPHAVIAAGWPANPHQPIQICSIDTVKARLKRGLWMPQPKLNVFDECHHMGAAGWRDVMSYYSMALQVGLSATPERLDGVGLEDSFASMVCGPSTAALIAARWLVDFAAFAPDEPDFSKVHAQGGDYARKESAGRMDKPVITASAIDYYLRNTPDAPGIAFCVNREHSEHAAQEFRDAGVVAVHIDGDTDRGIRREANRDFERGNIKVLFNVGLFGEGYDVPEAVTLIDLNPTKSLAWCLQKYGRVLRTAPGKARAFIHDHAGNLRRHGLPDAPRSWSLAGEDRSKGPLRSCGGERLQKCPKCSETARMRTRCKCGYLFETQGRFIEQVEGELRETPRAERAALDAGESAIAETVEDLTAIGRRRGYHDPARWAQMKWMERHAPAVLEDG